MKAWHSAGVQFKGEKHVVDVLEEGGVKKEEIDSVIWSHWHFDHTGDTSPFPSNTELVVGPGFSNALIPGYPANENSPILETDYNNRPLREIDFDNEKTHILGRFDALDNFADGSFYLLDALGHTVSRINALARTKLDAFIFMGADTCHHVSELRSTKYLPPPKEISPSPFSDPPFGPGTTCPGSLLQSIHPRKLESEPFYTAAGNGEDFYEAKSDEASSNQDREGGVTESNREVLLGTVEKITEFDAHDNVLTIIAHDASLYEVLEFYPKYANSWKEKGWKPDSMWCFLANFKGAVGAVTSQAGIFAKLEKAREFSVRIPRLFRPDSSW